MMSIREFCRDVLTDGSPNGDVLLEHLDEIVDKIGTASAATSTGSNKRKSSSHGGADEDNDGGGGSLLLAKIKARYDTLTERGGEEDGGTVAKKAKSEKQRPPPSAGGGTADAKKEQRSEEEEDLLDRQAVAYGEYHDMTAAELKDVLSWNRQFKTGTKNVLLLKCVDGRVRGRLGCCGLCGGRLKLLEDGATVKCDGIWNEEMNYKVTCAYSTNATDAPRFHPWYHDNPPTEEQVDEMERLVEEAKDGGGGGTVVGSATSAAGGGGDDITILVEATREKCPVWDLSSGDKIVKTAMSIVEVMRNHPGKTVDLPPSDQAAKKAVGTILMSHKTLGIEQGILAIVKSLGFVEDKKAKAAKKQAAVAEAVKHPANAELVAAFTELADYYFRESNQNAGASTSKVASALSRLTFAVTQENAMGLGKGKTKVANIGAKSAEKIHEFVSTGRIEKLDEKRAAHGG
jgi:hypothetical protein